MCQAGAGWGCAKLSFAYTVCIDVVSTMPRNHVSGGGVGENKKKRLYPGKDPHTKTNERNEKTHTMKETKIDQTKQLNTLKTPTLTEPNQTKPNHHNRNETRGCAAGVPNYRKALCLSHLH